MKFFGHPLHMMLIHFPAALFPMECVVYGLLFYTNNHNFGFVSYCILIGGVGMGWVAAILGALDMNEISEDNEQVMKKALLHGGINGIVVVSYTVIAYQMYQLFPELPDGNIILMLVRVLLVLLLMVGNFIGGSLVLKDKVGIDLIK